MSLRCTYIWTCDQCGHEVIQSITKQNLNPEYPAGWAIRFSVSGIENLCEKCKPLVNENVDKVEDVGQHKSRYDAMD